MVAGMTWKAAGCGRCQDLQGALSRASGQGQAGRAGLQEGAVGQPPAREACASPARLRLWERGVGYVTPRVGGCRSVLEMKVRGDFIHPGFSSVLMEGCSTGCHFFRVQLSEDPK